ncbi:gliding motility-associated ABC transporter permease subunit GldF [Lacihabitans sp. LS3-19]|uniref:gliding motility-associated ABC transporter permease subunit GldF n=1 Tax=Lacihabitans sp. LS3-19 TaxID=2487335 RepID=UPI0020CDDFD9|nr:gliding motility-associated ABC transporter permease subunit GldF [Lacihabitans sp. LS3-19]MCP9771009.1 gliding motility-associated ABC transporter permease subunit GldF [Lacihabitans sp. LS3-19]
MFSIFKKEVSSYFNSLIAYIVIGVFLLLTGLMLWMYPNSNVLDYGYAEMTSFFDFCPYIFLLLIPAVTMRMFSEEFRTGTVELLFTKPISLWGIILGKYFATLFILVLAILPTLVYFVSIYLLGNPKGNIDSASVFGSYFGLILLAAAYAAIGIFTSTLSKNQVVAFILAAIISYFFYDGLGQLASIFRGSFQYYLNFLGLDFHYSSLGKGMLDSRNIVYLISFSGIFLVFTHLLLNKSRK